MDIWNEYNEFFTQFDEFIRRPIIPENCKHNAHMYYLLFKNLEQRTKFIKHLRENDILSVFHYIPLHSSPAGQKFARTYGKMDVTNKISDTLVRLPLFYELTDEQLCKIKSAAQGFFMN